MPEHIFDKIKKNILPQWKVCFMTALVIGLIAHIYKLTNWLPNWDGLVFRYDAQNMIPLGRWFLPVICSLSSFYDLPFINGFIAIILHGLGAVCICKMFHIEKSTTAGMIGALVITLPTVSSVMMYNYVADGYAFAFLLSCSAAMLLTKEKPNYLLSAIFIALSAGIYQAYITVTITLLLLNLILETIEGKVEIKKLLGKSFKFLFTGISGFLLYYLILMLLLKLTGTQLLDYQGINSSVSFDNIKLADSLYTAKETLIGYFFDFSNGISVFTITNCLVFALTFALCLFDVIKNKNGIFNFLLLCIYVLLLPIGACALAFINSHIDYHNLMRMGFMAFYLLPVLHYEKLSFKSEKLNAAKSWAILGIAVLLISTQIVIANVSYHKLTMAYEKSYGTLIRIADRIEQTDGADSCEKILVMGELSNSKAYSAILPPDMTGTTDGHIIRADDETVSQSVLCSAINDYCDKNYKFLSGIEKTELMKKINRNDLGNWPENNSIFVIDDVIVIKLSD